MYLQNIMFHKFDQDGGKNWLPNERKKNNFHIFIFIFQV